jgi:diketogulonate reductase-like aldo/keto reductase
LGIAGKKQRTVAQVILRWLIQRKIVVIPKSVRKERMEENFNVFDFQLSDDEMNSIAGLDNGQSLFFDHRDPERIQNVGKLKFNT